MKEDNKKNIKEQAQVNKEEQSNKEERTTNFFKKIWYSITKIDKYAELSAEGFNRAIKYLMILVLILSITISALTIVKANKVVKDIAQFIQEEAPELNYSEGKLIIESEQPINYANDNFGKVIIDTNTENEEEINKYVEEINNEENGLIVLNDRIILKEEGTQGNAIQHYTDIFTNLNIDNFGKQDIVNYLTSSNMISIYTSVFILLCINSFIIYFFNTIINVLAISLIGHLATKLLKLKIRYVAVFNMAVYSITLSTLLNVIYIIINSLFRYIINYFDLMYILVASIYMIASIFLLKSEFNKKQGEVQKIIEVENQIKEELNNKEDKKEDKEKNKETKKEDKEEKQENNEIEPNELKGEGEA